MRIPCFHPPVFYATIGQGNEYNLNLDRATQPHFPYSVARERRLRMLRLGARHGSDLGDEYAIGVALAALALVQCGFVTFFSADLSSWRVGRHGGP